MKTFREEIQCLQCNRWTIKTKSSKKYCSNRCRVKAHRLRHDLPLIRDKYDPYELIKCNIKECENYKGETARCYLKRMGCLGMCC